MQNDEGDVVDMYLPRKCSATNAIIGAKDHASVQINVAKLDKDGRMTGEYNTYAFCGEIRGMSESDDALNRLTQLDGILHVRSAWLVSRLPSSRKTRPPRPP